MTNRLNIRKDLVAYLIISSGISQYQTSRLKIMNYLVACLIISPSMSRHQTIKQVLFMHQSIESPGGGGGGDGVLTFCTILHSPHPPGHIFCH